MWQSQSKLAAIVGAGVGFTLAGHAEKSSEDKWLDGFSSIFHSHAGIRNLDENAN